MSEENKADFKVIETNPSINKVILVEGGTGGLKINYNIGQSINGVMNNKQMNAKIERPVHQEVRDGFKDLRLHLLKSVGFVLVNEKIESMLLSKCVVTTVLISKKDQLQISGYILQNGTHHAAIASPFLTSDDYTMFSELQSLVHKICDEAKLFMNGTKSASKTVVLLDYLKVKKEIPNPEEAIMLMSDDEFNSVMNEALNDSGLRLVMEEVNGVMTEVIAPVEEPKQESLDFEEKTEDVEHEEIGDENEESKADFRSVTEIEEPAFEEETHIEDEESPFV